MDSARDALEKKAFQIFLKKMPTMHLTDESVKGFKSIAEQSVEIAQMFEATFKETLKAQEDKS